MEYDARLSDDGRADNNSRNAHARGADRSRDQGKAKAIAARPKETARARWEAGAQRNWDLQEGEDGSLEGVLGGLEEASKRARYAPCTNQRQNAVVHPAKHGLIGRAD